MTIPETETDYDVLLRYMDYYLKVHAVALKDGVVVEIDPQSKIRCAEELCHWLRRRF